MPLSSSLSPEFLLWAASKIQPLVDARREDDARNDSRLSNFNLLLPGVLADYDRQPFAQPDFHSNLDPGGRPRHTFQYLRMRASQFLNNQATPGGTCPYERPAESGHLPPLDVCSAPGLWALTEGQRLRALTCSAFHISVDTPVAHLPTGFLPQFNAVVQLQFDLLGPKEQSEWRNLALECRQASERGMFDMIALHRKQLEFIHWMKHTLAMEMSTTELGMTCFLGMECFWMNAETRRGKLFRGQVSTYEGGELWHKISDYDASIAPRWRQFIASELEGRDAMELPPMTLDAPITKLFRYRDALELFLEELFRCQVNASETLNVLAFWKDVAAHPTAFVSCQRLPTGISFCNPQDMPPERFRAFYQHVRDCHYRGKDVHPDNRFTFEPEIIRAYYAMESAHKLKVQQSERERTHSNAVVDANGVPASDNGYTTQSFDTGTAISVSGGRVGQVMGEDPAAIDIGKGLETQGRSV